MCEPACCSPSTPGNNSGLWGRASPATSRPHANRPLLRLGRATTAGLRQPGECRNAHQPHSSRHQHPPAAGCQWLPGSGPAGRARLHAGCCATRACRTANASRCLLRSASNAASCSCCWKACCCSCCPGWGRLAPVESPARPGSLLPALAQAGSSAAAAAAGASHCTVIAVGSGTAVGPAASAGFPAAFVCGWSLSEEPASSPLRSVAGIAPG